MTIQSKAASREYLDNYDKIFKKRSPAESALDAEWIATQAAISQEADPQSAEVTLSSTKALNADGEAYVT